MKKILLSLMFLLVLSGGYAHAQTPSQPFCQNGTCTYVSLEPIPLPGGGVVNANSFQSYVSGAFKLLLAAGSATAVVMLVIGALTYMFSDVVGHKTKALARIRGAMWAIVLLVSCYLILNTINPDLVTFKLDLNAINNPTGATPTPATSVPITNPSGTNIYNGSNAYDQLMNLQSQCQSPKAVHATSNGRDSGGEYVSWTCQ